MSGVRIEKMTVKFRWFALVALLICCFKAVAQDRKKPTKILIDYSVGHNDWGIPGIYSRREIFEITPVMNNSYSVNGYKRIISSLSPDSATRKQDTIRMRFNSSISQNQVDSLYGQLTTSKDNFNYAFIRPRLKTPSKTQILTLATNDSLHYKFEDEDRSDIRAKIKKIRNFDKLDSFINLNKPDPKLLSVAVSDAWDFVRISYIYKNDTIRYDGQFWGYGLPFFKPLGQPFGWISFKKGDFRDGTVNLEINTLIESILPKKSLLRKQIGINSLTEEYIHWYLDKVL
jgi:hypothetical protein